MIGSCAELLVGARLLSVGSGCCWEAALGPTFFVFMKLKNKNEVPVGGYSFHFYGVSLEAVGKRRMQTITCDSISQLTEKTRLTFLAQSIPFPDNMQEIIEHQICIRQPNPPEACWSSGFGDDLHSLIVPFVKKIADKLEAGKNAKLASRLRKVSDCSSCGGTSVFDPNVNNLGRAGKVNHLLPHENQG